MARIELEAWDIIIHNSERWVGMVLPCRKVITYEIIGQEVKHAVANIPPSGSFKILDDKDFPNEIMVKPEIIIALKCARYAICVEKEQQQ